MRRQKTGKVRRTSPVLLLLRVALLELLNASARLNVALTSREERMAFRADIDAEIALGRAGLERVCRSRTSPSPRRTPDGYPLSF